MMAVNRMRDLLGFVYGAVYGVALVVPGLSGGTFLVIFGCYDTICEALSLDFKVIRKRFFFLLLFGIGALGGLIGFVNVFTLLLHTFPIQTNLFFTGLILGGLPLILRIATEEEKLNPIYLLPFIAGLALVVSLFLAERAGLFDMGAVRSAGLILSLRIALYAFVAGLVMILPGISGAFVLVAFGVYDMFAGALKSLDFNVLIPAAIGILLGLVAGARLVLLILKKYKLPVYCMIAGMVTGSTVPLFPGGAGFNLPTLAGVLCMALSAWIAWTMGKRETGKQTGDTER